MSTPGRWSSPTPRWTQLAPPDKLQLQQWPRALSPPNSMEKHTQKKIHCHYSLPWITNPQWNAVSSQYWLEQQLQSDDQKLRSLQGHHWKERLIRTGGNQGWQAHNAHRQHSSKNLCLHQGQHSENSQSQIVQRQNWTALQPTGTGWILIKIQLTYCQAPGSQQPWKIWPRAFQKL